jgi:hypothetical protein
MENLTIAQIADLRVVDCPETGIETVALPSGRTAFRVPRYSENSNGWWAGDILVHLLFNDIQSARAERDGL